MSLDSSFLLILFLRLLDPETGLATSTEGLWRSDERPAKVGALQVAAEECRRPPIPIVAPCIGWPVTVARGLQHHLQVHCDLDDKHSQCAAHYFPSGCF